MLGFAVAYRDEGRARTAAAGAGPGGDARGAAVPEVHSERLKGTMGALYLKDLAYKTRRGLRGRVEAGKSGGGNSYGYDVVRGGRRQYS